MREALNSCPEYKCNTIMQDNNDKLQPFTNSKIGYEDSSLLCNLRRSAVKTDTYSFLMMGRLSDI